MNMKVHFTQAKTNRESWPLMKRQNFEVQGAWKPSARWKQNKKGEKKIKRKKYIYRTIQCIRAT